MAVLDCTTCDKLSQSEILKLCKKICNKEMTIEDILTDTTKCNFCDVPYILINKVEGVKLCVKNAEKAEKKKRNTTGEKN